MPPQLRPKQRPSRSRSPPKNLEESNINKEESAPSIPEPIKKSANGRPEIVPRSYRFQLPKERVLDWDVHGSHNCAYMNTMSIFFPLGEQWFIRAVKLYQHVVPKDSKLFEEVRSFVQQESIHSREHELYNDALREHAPVQEMEYIIDMTLKAVNLLPNCISLGGTIALEHLTASLGHSTLLDPTAFDGSEPHFKAMWYWHSHEEIEHKAVAFDVYVAAFGTGLFAYALRMFTYILALIIFGSLLYPFYIVMLYKTGHLFDLKGWKEVYEVHWGEIGMIRRITPILYDYTRRDFHPWQLDDSHLLTPLTKPPQ